MKPLPIIEPVRELSLVHSTACLNRFELLVTGSMDSDTMCQWAHDALDHWLRQRMDLTSPSVYDSGNTGKGGDHG